MNFTNKKYKILLLSLLFITSLGFIVSAAFYDNGGHYIINKMEAGYRSIKGKILEIKVLTFDKGKYGQGYKVINNSSYDHFIPTKTQEGGNSFKSAVNDGKLPGVRLEEINSGINGITKLGTLAGFNSSTLGKDKPNNKIEGYYGIEFRNNKFIVISNGGNGNGVDLNKGGKSVTPGSPYMVYAFTPNYWRVKIQYFFEKKNNKIRFGTYVYTNDGGRNGARDDAIGNWVDINSSHTFSSQCQNIYSGGRVVKSNGSWCNMNRYEYKGVEIKNGKLRVFNRAVINYFYGLYNAIGVSGYGDGINIKK